MTRLTLRTLAWFTAASVPASAALVTNVNLGNLGLGAHNITGDTSTGSNEVGYYGPNEDLNWGNEVVFEFNTSQNLLFDLTINSSTGDPDFFLLGSLGVVPGLNGKNTVADLLGIAFLDFGAGDSSTLGVFGPGTYFLAISSYVGPDGGVVPAAATFDVDLGLAAAPLAPAAISLGILGNTTTAFSIDSLGSDYDTELALWDSLGNVLFENDDAVPGSVFQSEIDPGGPLAAGTYYLSLGGYDTEWAAGFQASGSQTDFGDYVLNHPNGSTTGAAGPDETVWFSFMVVPEPGLLSLLGLGGLLLARRRRG